MNEPHLSQLLELLYPLGGLLEVALVHRASSRWRRGPLVHRFGPLVHRASDFFLGLNAGQWLRIRIAQISDGARAHLAAAAAAGASAAADPRALDRALREAGLASAPPGAAEPPPPDAAHLFHFYGNFAVTPDSLGR